MAAGEAHDKKKMYHPWFPSGDDDSSFLSYIHQNLHHETGEDVGFPDSSWSYTREESPFEAKERSDATLLHEVEDLFYKSKEVDGSRVEILVHNGIVNLSGSVRTEREKKRAEELVRCMDHVWNVENEIRIEDDSAKRKGYGLPGFL
jgi:hypothetical protein